MDKLHKKSDEPHDQKAYSSSPSNLGEFLAVRLRALLDEMDRVLGELLEWLNKNLVKSFLFHFKLKNMLKSCKLQPREFVRREKIFNNAWKGFQNYSSNSGTKIWQLHEHSLDFVTKHPYTQMGERKTGKGPQSIHTVAFEPRFTRTLISLHLTWPLSS